MMTDDERSRIRAEEVFREEVRRELENLRPRATRATSLVRFFNTSLGVWFLSTVVVGVASFLVAQWRVSREERSRDADQVVRIDLEIATRLDNFANAVNGLVMFDAYAHAVAALNRPASDEDGASAYPEYRGLALTTLLHELSVRVPDEERPRALQLLESARQLSAIHSANLQRFRHADKDDDNAIDPGQLENVYEIVNSSFRGTRYPGTAIK